MNNASRTAVMLMAYGTPRTKEEILPYYTDIRRGRAPTDEQLNDLIARYEAIGGLSPLKQLTEAQRDSLQEQLDLINPGHYQVFLGLKHATLSPKSQPLVSHVLSVLFLLRIIRHIRLVNTQTEFALLQHLTILKCVLLKHGHVKMHSLNS
jgi:protoheme ferro-lyase